MQIQSTPIQNFQAAKALSTPKQAEASVANVLPADSVSIQSAPEQAPAEAAQES